MHPKPCILNTNVQLHAFSISGSSSSQKHLIPSWEKNILKPCGSQTYNRQMSTGPSPVLRGNQLAWDILNSQPRPDFHESSGVSLKHH